jgi:hypothetical protein
MPPSGAKKFPTTSWSLIRRAANLETNRLEQMTPERASFRGLMLEAGRPALTPRVERKQNLTAPSFFGRLRVFRAGKGRLRGKRVRRIV